MGNNMNDAQAAQDFGVRLMVMQDEEEEEHQAVMALNRIFAAELMELEEGVGLGDQHVWVPITVFINEYHAFGDPCFKLHFRMNRALFELLTTTVYDHLQQRRRVIRERTPFQDVMLMVIWLMATPDTFRSVALRFGVAPSTLYYFYAYVVEALRELAEEYIRWLGPVEREQIKGAFVRATGFPDVIGCIDCTHINISAPLVDAGQYVNRHHVPSINVQTVVDHTLTIHQLHVGEVGSMNDNRVFQRSPLYHDLLHNAPGVINIEEHLVGDGAYTLTNFMMIPFPKNGHLTERQLNFNRKLSQCRVRVENSYAGAKSKWRRLKFLHARNRQMVVDHITASFVLHNFLVRHGEPMIDEDELARPINDDEMLDNGDEEIVDDPQIDEQLQDAAEARGEEKRLMIMNHVLDLD